VVNAYLMVYNLASFLGWGYVLYKTADHYAHGGPPADMYSQTGELTKWVQTGALLEIVHAVLGFVRSPVGTTATQVFSRIMLVWGVMHLFPKPDVGIDRAKRGLLKPRETRGLIASLRVYETEGRGRNRAVTRDLRRSTARESPRSESSTKGRLREPRRSHSELASV
jgi:hypothetical protein